MSGEVYLFSIPSEVAKQLAIPIYILSSTIIITEELNSFSKVNTIYSVLWHTELLMQPQRINESVLLKDSKWQNCLSPPLMYFHTIDTTNTTSVSSIQVLSLCGFQV